MQTAASTLFMCRFSEISRRAGPAACNTCGRTQSTMARLAAVNRMHLKMYFAANVSGHRVFTTYDITLSRIRFMNYHLDATNLICRLACSEPCLVDGN